MRLICGLVVAAFFLEGTLASHFDIQLIGSRPKCYTEDLAANTLIIAEIEPRDNAMLTVEVSSRNPREMYYEETSQSLMKTAFTMQRGGMVDVCVENRESKNAISYAGLRILTGTLAKDFSNIAKKEHLDPVIKELQNVESLLTDFSLRQKQLVGKETVTRRLVDLAHSRVVYLAIANVAVVVICNVMIAFILKAFFKSKKII